MLVSQLAKLVLAAAALAGPSVVAQKGCTNPSIRREWRSMSPQERAEWIDAVKVEHPLRGPHVTNDASSSVSTTYPTTLLWFRPTTLPSP